MIDSRDIKDLHPIVASLAKTLLGRAKKELGIDLLITSTLRDNECKAKLYAKGRTSPGPAEDEHIANEYTHIILKKDFILNGKLICKYEPDDYDYDAEYAPVF